MVESTAAAIVGKAVSDLGFDLVEFERAPGGLLRVYIDRPADRSGAITVDDCALVSNQLTRIFAVEGVDFSRLEVSSPGLDRPLTRLQDFQRFAGSPAKVRLRTMVDGRKRFNGLIVGVEGESITFTLVDDAPAPAGRVKKPGKAGGAKSPEPKPEQRITVGLVDIERARLIPEI